jgi:hypothetical protein
MEFVASNPDEPEKTWYTQEFGGGVMIGEPQDPNLRFLRAVGLDRREDLGFLA